jgi:hypothetical protein
MKLTVSDLRFRAQLRAACGNVISPRRRRCLSSSERSRRTSLRDEHDQAATPPDRKDAQALAPRFDHLGRPLRINGKLKTRHAPRTVSLAPIRCLKQDEQP